MEREACDVNYCSFWCEAFEVFLSLSQLVDVFPESFCELVNCFFVEAC